MKMRNGFVSNSSSSSFVVVSLGSKEIIVDGDIECEQCGSFSYDIDKMIAELQEAKENGIKEIVITHGGGFIG